MAVGDQHPPQVLFLRRNRQGNIPLQQPHPLQILDHYYSAMFLNNGVAINSRKRRKEDADTNLFSLQHQPPPPQTLLSTALRLDINDKQPPPPQPPTPPPQPPPHKMFLPQLSFTSLLTEERYAEIVEQSDQIDEIIKTHTDEMRRTLAEKWKMHYSTLLCAAEERASKRLKERELELERSVRRNAELEQRAAQFRAEAQVWQERAKKLEETAVSLREALLRQQATMREGGAGWGAAEDAESSYVDPDRVDSPVSLACKACGQRVAEVMMWPCRHVCVCRRCNDVTKACPVCHSLKTTSVEVFLS